jgi:hypothetical protein
MNGCCEFRVGFAVGFIAALVACVLVLLTVLPWLCPDACAYPAEPVKPVEPVNRFEGVRSVPEPSSLAALSAGAVALILNRKVNK